MRRGVFAMIEQDGSNAGMSLEEANEFGATIAAISNDAGEEGHWLFIQCYE